MKMEGALYLRRERSGQVSAKLNFSRKRSDDSEISDDTIYYMAGVCAVSGVRQLRRGDADMDGSAGDHNCGAIFVGEGDRQVDFPQKGAGFGRGVSGLAFAFFACVSADAGG